MSYAERLSRALKETPGKTRAGLASALGISPQAVGQAVNGATRAFTAENNAKAAAYLLCNPTWLASGREPMRDAIPVSAPAAPPRNFEDPRQVTEEEFTIIRDFRDLSESERDKFKATLHEMATAFRELRAAVIDDLKAKGWQPSTKA